MKNSRKLKVYAAVAIVCAVSVWGNHSQPAAAQSKPTGRTYQIFPGITFPNFPGTGSPSTPPKPVLPLVEVPTPGLQPMKTTRRRSTTEQPSAAEKPRTRRIRRNVESQSTEEKPKTRRLRRAKPQQ
jgi:hypothetical protein